MVHALILTSKLLVISSDCLVGIIALLIVQMSLLIEAVDSGRSASHRCELAPHI